MDFTLKTFRLLLSQLLNCSFQFMSFKMYVDYCNSLHSTFSFPFIVLRHDVDRRPQNALAMAEIEHTLGIQGSYYFRIVPSSFDLDVIKKIAGMGHEIGYHYEDLALVGKEMKSDRRKKNKKSAERHADMGKRRFFKNHLGKENAPHDVFVQKLIERGINSFESNLALMRKVADIQTICMHGNPLSRWDNRLLWKFHNYRHYDIMGEPYFDVNWSHVFYLTDTGRRWDGERVSVRDKVVLKLDNGKDQIVNGDSRIKCRTTFDIIRAAKNGKLPGKIMLTVHPQRWTNRPELWTKELLWQGLKNIIKRHIVRYKSC